MDTQALIILAEMLDKARLQANAIEITAPENGTYGDIKEALIDVLAIITDRFICVQVYDNMLENGNTVRQALAEYGVQ